MTEGRETRGMTQGFSFGAVVLWPAVVGFAYLLSVGPVLRILQALQHGSNSAAWKAFDIFYTPIGWLMETPLRGPLDWYINLWTDRLPPFRILLA